MEPLNSALSLLQSAVLMHFVVQPHTAKLHLQYYIIHLEEIETILYTVTVHFIFPFPVLRRSWNISFR